MMSMTEKYLGRNVTVYYAEQMAAHRDDGTLAEFDGQIVLLERKGRGDLLIPLTAIRILVLRSDALPASLERSDPDASALPHRESKPIINRYLGQSATVYYRTGDVSDEGTLTEYDGLFVHLDRAGKGNLLIPLMAIRIIALQPNTLPIPAMPSSPDISALPRPSSEPEEDSA